MLVENNTKTNDPVDFYVDIFNRMQVGLHVYHLEDINDDSTLRMITANFASSELTGIPVGDVIGRTLDDNFPGLREKGIPQKYANVVKTQKAIELEDIYYGDDRVINSAFSVKAFPLPNDCVGVTFENITERKIAAEMHERHSAFALNNPAPLLQIGYNGIIISANPTSNNLFSGKLIGNTISQVLPGLDENTIDNLSVEKAIQLEDKVKDKTFLFTVIKYAHTQSIFIYGSDITDQVKAKENQNRITAQLMQSDKMAAIGTLAAGVAHEINNPIGFINSNLNTMDKYLKKINTIMQKELKEGSDPYDDMAEMLEDFCDAIAESLEGTDRVKKIITDLKSFSRVDKAEKGYADINEGIETTLNIVWNELKYKCNVKKYYGELTPIMCIPNQLNQVFMNLLINASHAIEKKGIIEIRTWKDKENIFISIKDNGCGIPENNINKIFEPFFTTKDVGKGTGLGLSLVYDIVKKHNGRINVKSELGAGTEFIIMLPVGKMNKATDFSQAGIRGSEK